MLSRLTEQQDGEQHSDEPRWEDDVEDDTKADAKQQGGLHEASHAWEGDEQGWGNEKERWQGTSIKAMRRAMPTRQ